MGMSGTTSIEASDRAKAEWSQHGHLIPGNSGTSMSADGLYQTKTHSDNTSSQSNDGSVDGWKFKQSTSDVSENGIATRSNNLVHCFNSDPLVKTKFQLDKITDIRSFVGIADVGDMLDVLISDLSAKNVMGVRFNPTDGDSNYMIITCNGTTQTLTDTGLAPVADVPVVLLMDGKHLDSEIRFTMYSASFDQVVEKVVTLTLPVATTIMRAGWGMATNTAAVVNFSTYGFYGWNRNT